MSLAVEDVARAILTERLGADAAKRCEGPPPSVAWKDAIRYAKAALKLMDAEVQKEAAEADYWKEEYQELKRDYRELQDRFEEIRDITR